MNFAIIGDGTITKKHKRAIGLLGGNIVRIYDPLKYSVQLNDDFFTDIDWIVICSPNYLHYEHLKTCLKYNVKIICEKPMILPWQPMIDDERINIVLQYRWLDFIPKKIEVRMVRNSSYLQSWKGDKTKTGGMFYNLFIHYIDLAMSHRCNFKGCISRDGENIRRIDDLDMFTIDTNSLYTKMYDDIINHDKGIKPKDIFYLHWYLNKYGVDDNNIIDKTIEMDFR